VACCAGLNREFRNTSKGRRHRHCKCPLHVHGTLRGEIIRRALDLTSWEAAQNQIRDWELGIIPEETISIADAKTRFLEDAEARKLSREILKKYRGLLAQLELFAESRQDQLEVAVRKTW